MSLKVFSYIVMVVFMILTVWLWLPLFILMFIFSPRKMIRILRDKKSWTSYGLKKGMVRKSTTVN